MWMIIMLVELDIMLVKENIEKEEKWNYLLTLLHMEEQKGDGVFKWISKGSEN